VCEMHACGLHDREQRQAHTHTSISPSFLFSPSTHMATLDEAAFIGDPFEPATWLRDLCARRPAGEALDR